MLHVPITVDANPTGELMFQSDAIRRLSSLIPGVISITSKNSPERSQVEAFIESIYDKTYGAAIGSHYPMLLSVRDRQGKILAALGFRPAARAPLFMEQYLDIPVENAISRAFSCPVARERIVEIGNLASAGHGGAVFLFIALMAYLDCQKFSHLALTGTKVLRGYFRKLGLDPRIMGVADPSRLPDGGKSWGTYYATEPKLIGGDVSASYRQLQQVMLVEQVCESGEYHAWLHPEAE